MKVQQLLSLLYSALIQYQQILTQIEQYASNPPEELIFKVLIARDAVQDALNKGKSRLVVEWVNLSISGTLS